MKKQITVLIIFIFAALGNIYAQSPAFPALPQKTVNLNFPMQGGSPCPTLTTGSECIRYVPAGNAESLQKTFNAATCGDTIVLVAGSTYSGNFTIPSTSCSGWIIVESSLASTLPPPGNRVGPTNLSSMATVSTPNTDRAIRFLPNANHWRFMGLEITMSYVSTIFTVSNIVSAGLQPDNSKLITVQSQLPAYLIFDRIYLHGLSNANSKHGFEMDAQYVAVVDSYCDEIHDNGSDAQCFYSINGPGPFLIQNNFIQASTENILFGGGDPAIPNLIPSDITIVGNVIQKNQRWRGQSGPYNWSVKNLLEFKNAQRVLIDGNVLQFVWQANQAGFAVKLTPRNQSGSCTWCAVQDFTITHNLIRHVAMGVEGASGDAPSPYGDGAGYSLPTARMLVQNNILDDVSDTNWGPGDGSVGRAFEIVTNANAPSPHDIIFDHNTALPSTAAVILGDTGKVLNMQFTNNICAYGVYGVKGSGTAGGKATLDTFAPGYIWANTILMNASGTSDGNEWPASTLWAPNTTSGFTNFVVANYQLASVSPYHNEGTDGKDIGVWDWTCLSNDVAATLAGKFVPTPACASAPLNSDTWPAPPTNVRAVVD